MIIFSWLRARMDPLRFGRLTAIRSAGYRKGQSYMLCRCDCGVEKEIALVSLRTGRTRSCGCLRREKGPGNKRHGLSESRAYNIWLGMRQRCNNPASPAYPNYGGRGIRIDSRWDDFAKFYEDMGEPPEGSSIDRIDNDKGYSPSNCRWADRLTQGRNKRGCVLLTYKGQTKTMSEWADEYGIRRQTFTQRIRNGWPMERALTQSPLTYHRRSPETSTTA